MKKTVLLFGSSSDLAKSFYNLYNKNYNLIRISCTDSSADFSLKEYSEKELTQLVNDISSINKISGAIIFNGIGRSGYIGLIPFEKVQAMVNINLTIPYLIMHVLTSIFQKQKFGHLLVIGSVAGLKYSPKYAMYSATKFALRALVEAYRNEVQDYGIKVSLIQAGFIETKFWNTFGENETNFNYDKKISILPDDVSETLNFCLESTNKCVVNELTCRSVYQER